MAMLQPLLNTLAGLAAIAVALPYLHRVNAMSWRTHRACVLGLHLVQLLWLVAVAWRAFDERDVDAYHLLGIAAAAIWIWISHRTWRGGPPEHTTRPTPLDSLQTTGRSRLWRDPT